MSALPGGRLEADEEVIRQIRAEFVDGPDQLSFTEKQQVLALLDVQVRLERTGRIGASLATPRPAEADHGKY